MTRYEQAWVDELVGLAAHASETEHESCRVLWIVTDTESGKSAFHLDLDKGRPLAGSAGKLPRGHKADITLTVKESVAVEIWSGSRSRDVAFMIGDVKVEGAYERWLDELVPVFAVSPWAEAWAQAAH
jgi:hypothetical protein